MSDAALDNLIACQAQLLATLDARDAAQIERAAANMASALAAVRALDVWHDRHGDKAKLDYCLKQVDAARIRVNLLTDWTCQKLETLRRIRGNDAPTGYKNPVIQAF